MDLEHLKEIEEDIATCTRCPLFNTRTLTVPGWYPEKSKPIVFIADGPHAIEDSAGKPILGREGRELTDMVREYMDLERLEYSILYCVKCIPLHNKERTEPYLTEIFWCAKYLFEQLQILNPKLIITLGNTAFYTMMCRDGAKFLEVNTGIGPYTGKLFKTSSIFNEDIVWNLTATYDPAGWLRSHDKKAQVREHLQKAKEYYDEIISGKSIEDLYGIGPDIQRLSKPKSKRNKVPIFQRDTN